jgi:hypothetical protein
MNPDEQGDDPLEALKRLKAQPPSDPLEQLKALKTQPPQQGHDYHAEFQSGALAKRMAGANARDTASAEELDDTSAGPLRAAGQALAATGANIAQGIPGMERAQAAIGTIGTGDTYGQSLDRLRKTTGKIQGPLRTAERIAGSIPLMAVPGARALSPVAGGALLGGADQALSADEMSGGERAARTAGGAAFGAATGKLGEAVLTGGRMLLTKNPAANLLMQQAKRAESAKAMYDAALKSGQGKAITPEIQSFLADPEITPIIEQLQATSHRGVAAESPEMLDAIYKTLSDQAKLIKKGMSVSDPSRPNTGRFRGEFVNSMKNKLLSAMEKPSTITTTKEVPALETARSPNPSVPDAIDAFRARSGEAARRAQGGAQPNKNPFSSQASAETQAQRSAREMLERQSAEKIVSPSLSGAPQPHTITEETHLPAVMPTYRHAVEDYAKRSGEIEATQRGYDALRGGLSKRLPSSKNLTTKTPEGLTEWAKSITPAQKEAAQSGVLGGVKLAVKATPFTEGRRALLKAPSIGRSIGSRSQAMSDLLAKLGLVAANAAHLPQD